MKPERRKLVHIVIHGERTFYIAVIFVEVLTYTFSFLISGLAKKDIFNILEGMQVTLGIHSLNVLIALNVAVPLLINGIKQINSGLVAKVETRLKENLKANLLSNILEEGLGKKTDYSYGQAVSFFRNECEDIVSYFMQYYYQMPKIVLSIAILLVMFFVNPIFTVISLIPTFGMVGLVHFLGKYIVMNREAARRSTSEVSKYLENVFENIEYFKLTVSEKKLGEIFSEKCKIRAKNEIKDRMLDRVLGVLSENSANFVLGIVLLIAIPLYRNGSFSVGEFVMFEYYYAFLASLPDAVAKLIRNRKQSEVSNKRMQFSREKEYWGEAKNTGKELHIELYSKGKKITVNGKKGELILIRGGMENERGMILQRMFELCKENLKNTKCYYISQHPILFNDSVRNNICLGEPYDEKKMEQVLLETDLKYDIQSFENGIDKSAGKQGGAISGGQRKRVSIARALYAEATILFIDGLSETVDQRTEQIMISNILKQPDRIVFLASNKPAMIEKADHVIEI